MCRNNQKTNFGPLEKLDLVCSHLFDLRHIEAKTSDRGMFSLECDRSPCLGASALVSAGCAGVSSPPPLHTVKISKGNQRAQQEWAGALTLCWPQGGAPPVRGLAVRAVCLQKPICLSPCAVGLQIPGPAALCAPGTWAVAASNR